MVQALVVLLVIGSGGVLGTALLVRPHRPDAELDDLPRPMSALPPVPALRRASPEPAGPLPPPPRPVRRCGHCRAVGHTRALCPRLTGLQMLPGLTGSAPAPGQLLDDLLDRRGVPLDRLDVEPVPPPLRPHPIADRVVGDDGDFQVGTPANISLQFAAT